MNTPLTQHFALIAAPFTAMHPDGAVNLAAVPAQAQLLIANGVDGVFVCGTTGESMSLSVDERMQVAAAWRRAAGGRLKLFVHVGHTSLEEARRLARHAEEIGADAISAMAPCFFRPRSIEDLVAFCAEVAAAAPHTPFYYYHIPSMTGVDLPMYDFLQAARERIRTLAGIKFTSENLMDFLRCVHLDEGRYDMLFGRDEILLAGMAVGAKGAVGSTYNFAAPYYRAVIEAFHAGDLAAARRAQAKAAEVVAAFQKFGSVAAQKAIMRMIGVDCGPVRPPLRDLSEEEYRELYCRLEALGLFAALHAVPKAP